MTHTPAFSILRRFLLTFLLVVLTIAAGLLFCFRDVVFGAAGALSNSDFNIATIHSSTDRDGDGIDDQSDILAGARTYLASEPQYKSKYYAGGYPDDEFGVCTDVVAQAMLASGYNLRDLVNADIAQAPEAYNITQPDPNIDFRRVRNLRVYFHRHAISLTTDTTDIAQWQGGDIVIFKDHIGIVSDKRTRRGVPFILHNASPYQRSYEEDILERYSGLSGHYRLSK